MASSSNEVNLSGAVSPANDGGLFSEGERVLAFYGPQLYGAKIQKSERCGEEQKYLIHYLGWNKNWDELVREDRLLKHTEENLARQRILDVKEAFTRKTKSGRSAKAKGRRCEDTKADKEETKGKSCEDPKADKEETKGRSCEDTEADDKEDDTNINAEKEKKRKNESGDDTNSVSDADVMNIPIPVNLKKKLVDDLQNIKEKDKLVKLPRSPNVDDILSMYLEFKTKKDGTVKDSVAEILKGIKTYFDKALPVILLYKNERCQYQEIESDDMSPSSIYGGEHLLRLFVKLPELLSSVTMEEETWISMQQILSDFLKFIQKNHRTFLVPSAYECAMVSDGKGKEKEE